jgi:hypothetical protein
MLASLTEAFLAPDVEVSENEVEALKLLTANYTKQIIDSNYSFAAGTGVVEESLVATAFINALMSPLNSTHYLLTEAMNTREDAADLVLHSSEIQQACNSVLAQMFLITCNIYALQDDLDQNPDLMAHLDDLIDQMYEDAGAAQPDIQLELFA